MCKRVSISIYIYIGRKFVFMYISGIINKDMHIDAAYNVDMEL